MQRYTLLTLASGLLPYFSVSPHLPIWLIWGTEEILEFFRHFLKIL
ncbi:hypothetical protein [Moorena producens]|nr:hypothetical protein [Moorena producens]